MNRPPCTLEDLPPTHRLARCLALSPRHAARILSQVRRGQAGIQQDLFQLRHSRCLPPSPLCPLAAASLGAAFQGHPGGLVLWGVHETNYLRRLLALGQAINDQKPVIVFRARQQPEERRGLLQSAALLGLDLKILEGEGQGRALLRALRQGARVLLLGDALPGMHHGPINTQPGLGEHFPFSSGPFWLAKRAPCPVLPVAFLPKPGPEGGLTPAFGPLLLPSHPLEDNAKQAFSFFLSWLTQAPERWLLWHRLFSRKP